MDFLEMQTLFDKYVVNGGGLMWVLIPCSLLMVGTILQGMITLRRGRVLPRWVTRMALDVRDDAGRREYLQKLRGSSSPMARILWMTLKDLPAGGRMPTREVLQGKLEDAIIIVSDKMYERVGLLSTIYTVGPLLGLVGTILGLMDTFHSYGQMENPSVAMLSVGVQKALITTFWGLSMAIPAYVAGHWLQKKIRAYERDHFPDMAWRVIGVLGHHESHKLHESRSIEARESDEANQAEANEANVEETMIVFDEEKVVSTAG